MPPKAPLNPFSFPRPPLLEKTPRHLEIKWNGVLVADTKDAYWVLETTHAPTYYLPPQSILVPLAKSTHSSFCEWKGRATYWDIKRPSSEPSNSTKSVVRNRIWSYESPTKGFTPIKDYVSFYAGPWDCYVDGELVKPQPGDFYGGWMTSEIVGQVKGGPGTWGW
ncbi:hypothetical protein MMC19_004305 [Ptychographa xylographoides]|nr:hypothetical protein [Ptychographa xylographoides]